MKKLILSIIIVLFFFNPSHTSAREKIVHPPKDVKKLIGKIVNFTTETSPGRLWSYLIIGVSENPSMREESTIIYVGQVNYLGHEVKQISFNVGPESDWWQLDYYVPNSIFADGCSRSRLLTEEGVVIKILPFE